MALNVVRVFRLSLCPPDVSFLVVLSSFFLICIYSILNLHSPSLLTTTVFRLAYTKCRRRAVSRTNPDRLDGLEQTMHGSMIVWTLGAAPHGTIAHPSHIFAQTLVSVTIRAGRQAVCRWVNGIETKTGLLHGNGSMSCLILAECILIDPTFSAFYVSRSNE